MCEFCSLGPKRHDPDSTNAQFAGFFSDDAIQAALEQAAKQRSHNKKQHTGEEDDDGT